MQVPIVLGKTAKGYVVPRAGVEQVTVRLSDFNAGKPQVFYASALRRINERIVAAFNRMGLAGIFVAPHKDDIDSQTGKDLRKPADTAVRLVVWSASVAGVRTLASGDRVPTEARINNPVHEGILAESPLNTNDLLDKSLLDDYVFFLNRHPGRQVDLAVTSGEKAGQVNLDYMVSENKPWLAYAQASNTGTRATAPWRFRFGVIDNQLTNDDDILSAEYTTSCTEPDPKSQSASLSYEAPLLKIPTLRWRAYGSWGKFNANVATAGAGENWDGWEWTAGAELAYNFFQKKQTFLDLVAGTEVRQIFVDNRTANQQGLANLFVPHVGLRVESITDTATTVGSVFIEHNCSGLADSSREDYEELGRTHANADYELVKWDVLQTFFLEPLLNREAWMDTGGKDAWKNTTLAHEMAFQFRGQWTPGQYRMVPQNEGVAGGFFTVRGYPESVIAGDTVLIATGEYRLHVPRLFKPQETPGRLPLVGTPFRWSPQAIYGRPDWDLICRAFVDMAKASNSRPEVFEDDVSIWSMGLGVELQFTRNFNVRADLGLPCKDLKTNDTDINAGDPRLHFVATIIY
jgi:hemolysin activation/secretion protein